MDYKQLAALEKIKKVRKEKQLTYRALAEILNMSPTALCRIEKGERIPEPEQLSAICGALDIAGADKEHIMLGFGYMEV